MRYIEGIEQNYHGDYIIYGKAGKHIYSGYTKREAIRLYNKLCKGERK